MEAPALINPNPTFARTLSDYLDDLGVNVRAFNAKLDGSDDTTPWVDALGALPAGGKLIMPPGISVISPSALTASQPIIVKGSGRQASTIRIPADGDGFTVAADNVTFEDLTIERTGATNSGALIVLSSGRGAALNRVRLGTAYDHVRVENAYGWSAENSDFLDDSHYGFFIRSIAVPDRGDSHIEGCTFDTSRGGLTAIRHESGGGLYVSSSKFLHHTRSYDLQVEDGASTANTLFTGCSFENPVTGWVRLGRSGTTGVYDAIGFGGACQFRAIAGMTAGITVGAGITDFNLTGSIMRGLTSFIGVDITGGNDHYVGDNVFNALSQAVKVAGGIRARVGINHYDGITGLVVEGVPFEWKGTGVPTYGAASGSVFLRTDGGAGSTLYVREGAVWTAK